MNLYHKILYVVWPAFGFINSVRSFLKFKQVQTAGFIFFYALYGFGLVFNQTHDSSRYAGYLKEKSGQGFDAFYELINQVLEGRESPDFFQRFLEFSFSRFSNNEYFFFALLGAILGWALSNLFKELFKLDANLSISRHNIVWLFLLMIFLLLLPSRILSFRHYLATTIFAIGFIKIYQQNWKQGLLYWGSTAFIHFGFLLVFPVLALYAIFRRNLWMYYGFIIFSFVLADQVTPWLRVTFSEELEGNLNSALTGYTNSDYIEYKVNVLQQQTIGIITYFPMALRYGFFILLFLTFHFTESKGIAKKFDVSYHILLLLFGFLILFSGIPTVVERFSITYAIAAATYLYLSLDRAPKFTVFPYVVWGLVLWSFVLNGRLFFEFFNAYLMAPLGYISIGIDERFSILEIIRFW